MIGLGLSLTSATVLAAAGVLDPGMPGTPGTSGAGLAEFDPNRPAGTDADLYVAPSGDDANPGTLARPFATIQAAVDAAGPGQTIAARAGTYRESVTLPAGLHLKRYGAERVVVSGQDALTGWQACDAGDEALVGPDWGSVFKVTVPLSAFVGGHPKSAWPHEAGTPLHLAVDRRPAAKRDHFYGATKRYLTADSQITMEDPNSPGDLWYLGITAPEHLGGYTQAQLANALIAFIAKPNVSPSTPIESFDAATGTIYFEGAEPAPVGYANAARSYEPDGSGDEDRGFALLNALPRIEPGGWGYTVTGTDATLYVWPENPANVASGMSIAARGRGVRGGDDCTLEGIEIEGQASAEGGHRGIYPLDAEYAQRLTIRNCAVRNTYNGGGGYGALYGRDSDDLSIEGLTLDGVYGAHGMFLKGGARVVLRGVLARDVEQSPFRYYTILGGFFSRLRAVNTGFAAHANALNWYQGSDRVVLHASDLSGTSGYVTCQETSRWALVNVRKPMSFLDGRAIVDQNNATPSPADAGGYSGQSYLIGVETPPYPRVGDPDRAVVTLGRTTNPAVLYAVHGCILHGIAENFAGAINAASGNANTNPDPANRLPGDTAVAVADAYEDPETGDWRTPAGSGLRGLPTVDVSAQIAEIKGWLDFVDPARLDEWFDTDIAGDAVDWTARIPGARATFDTEATFPALVVDLPVSSIPTVGVELTPEPPFVLGEPRPGISYRWQSSADGTAWSDVAGATALAYTPAAGDEGRLLRLVVAVDGTDHVIGMDGAVLSGSNVPDTFFTVSGTGPSFVDPANGTPADTTVIELDALMRVPAQTDFTGVRQLFVQEADGIEIQVRGTGGSDGGPSIYLRSLSNSGGVKFLSFTRLADLTLDVWTRWQIAIDLGAGEVRVLVDGDPVNTLDLGPDGTGTTFMTAREIGFFAKTNGSEWLQGGIQIAHAEAFFTTAGVRSSRQRIEGDAATVNAHPWKAGTDAA